MPNNKCIGPKGAICPTLTYLGSDGKIVNNCTYDQNSDTAGNFTCGTGKSTQWASSYSLDGDSFETEDMTFTAAGKTLSLVKIGEIPVFNPKTETLAGKKDALVTDKMIEGITAKNGQPMVIKFYFKEEVTIIGKEANGSDSVRIKEITVYLPSYSKEELEKRIGALKKYTNELQITKVDVTRFNPSSNGDKTEAAILQFGSQDDANALLQKEEAFLVYDSETGKWNEETDTTKLSGQVIILRNGLPPVAVNSDEEIFKAALATDQAYPATIETHQNDPKWEIGIGMGYTDGGSDAKYDGPGAYAGTPFENSYNKSASKNRSDFPGFTTNLYLNYIYRINEGVAVKPGLMGIFSTTESNKSTGNSTYHRLAGFANIGLELSYSIFDLTAFAGIGAEYGWGKNIMGDQAMPTDQDDFFASWIYGARLGVDITDSLGLFVSADCTNPFAQDLPTNPRWEHLGGLVYKFGGDYDYSVTKVLPEEKEIAEVPDAKVKIADKPAVPQPVVPKKIALNLMEPIKVPKQMEFIAGQPTMKPGQEAKIIELLNEAEKQILAKFTNKLDNIPTGYTAKMTVEGFASSEGGYMEDVKDKKGKITKKGQEILTKGRANDVAGKINAEIEKRKKDSNSVFNKVAINTSNTKPVGRSEREVTIEGGEELAQGTFGGYDNDKANNKGETYLLCKGSTKADMNVEKECVAAGGTIVKEDKNASRKVKVIFDLLPPGSKVENTIGSVAGKDQSEANALLGRLTAWDTATKGLKKKYYNAEENAIYLLLDDTFMPKNKLTDEGKAEAFRKKLHTNAGAANLSGDCTIKVVHYRAPNTTVDEALLKKAFYLYDDNSSAFGDAGFDFTFLEEKFNAKTAVDTAAAATEAKKKLETDGFIYGNTIKAGGYQAVYIPVANAASLTGEESSLIRNVAAQMSAKSLTLYVIADNDDAEAEASSISMIVRSAFAGLKTMFFSTDDRVGNYVILIAGDSDVDMESKDDANAKELRSAIFNKLQK